MEANHIYQYSLLNALMSGVCETGITAKELLKKGCNQGLGTFARMNGELVLLDGSTYQLLPEGKTVKAKDDDQIPFATITNFVPQQKLEQVQLLNKGEVDQILNKFDDHAKNLFMTYRIQGRFAYMKYRTVRGQQYAGQPLSELGKSQNVEEYHDIEGVIVGFRSPANWQGFSVAGEHMHFISSDHTKGGHVLEMSSGATGLEVQIAVVSNVHIELPTSDDFNAAALTTDSDAVKKIEG